MSKKRKKKNNRKNQKIDKSLFMLKSIDKTMNKNYSDLIDEIQDYQRRLDKYDQKAIKKQKKKLVKQKMGVVPYYVSKDRLRIRQEMIEQMEKEELLDRIEKSFKSIVPIVTIIARLVAALILSIFSFEPICHVIKPETFTKMKTIYDIAMAI